MDSPNLLDKAHQGLPLNLSRQYHLPLLWSATRSQRKLCHHFNLSKNLQSLWGLISPMIWSILLGDSRRLMTRLSLKERFEWARKAFGRKKKWSTSPRKTEPSVCSIWGFGVSIDIWPISAGCNQGCNWDKADFGAYNNRTKRTESKNGHTVSFRSEIQPTVNVHWL